MRDSTDSGVYASKHRPIIHFGSPEGARYGDTTKAVITDFAARHPDFILDDGKDE